MSCGTPTDTLYGTLTTTTTGDPEAITSNSLSTTVISGTFPSSLCAETVSGQCVRSTRQTLSFTYTTVATNQIVLTTRLILTSTEVVPTQTLLAGCTSIPTPTPTPASTSESSITLSNGDVSVVSASSTVVTIDPSITSTSPNVNGGASQKKMGAIVGGTVAGVILLIILFAALFTLWRRNRKMSRLLKAHEEEEEKRNVSDADLLPSPYVQYLPSSPGSSSHPGYPLMNLDTYGLTDISPTSDAFRKSQDTHSQVHMVAASAGAGAVTTQYTPTHSRGGSTSMQAQALPRPHSVLGGTMPGVATVQGAGGPGTRSPSVTPQEVSGSVVGGMSTKAREAFGHRQNNTLFAQNADGDDRGGVDNENNNNDDSDIIVPYGATSVRSTAPPSAWMGPPPAYSRSGD